MPKRSTSHDVAREAGVSRTTVSLVLNNVPGVRLSDSTRQRVIEVAKKLNYHPDASGRKLVTGKSFSLGLVLRQNPEQVFADAFLLQVILGVEQSAEQAGYRVLLKPLAPDDGAGYSKLIEENHVDGIILSGPRKDDQEIIDLYKQGFPVMLMGQLPGVKIPFVDVDAVHGAKTATSHLIEQGHKRIAMITNAPLDYTSAQQRLEGYQQALKEAGLSFDDALVVTGNYTPASGFTAMNSILELRPLPTAVFVASDVVAMGAIQAIKKNGFSIPADFAIVGFDDVPLAEYYDPPLSTVRLPAFGLGWAAGERLSRLARGKPLEHKKFFLDTELIVRNSSRRQS